MDVQDPAWYIRPAEEVADVQKSYQWLDKGELKERH